MTCQLNLSSVSFELASKHMASSSLLLGSSILLIVFLQFFSFAEPTPLLDSHMAARTQDLGETTTPIAIDCDGACKYRCSKSSRPNLCRRACGTCCARCSCVPPGTSGNQLMCPCYAALTTHGGRPKCP